MRHLTKSLTCLTLVLLLAGMSGCKDAEVNEDGAVPVSEEAVEETVDETSPPKPGVDLMFYSMPEDPPGHDLVVGEAQILPEIQKPQTGGACPVRIASDGETTKVTILSMTINCCTERVQPSVVVKDGVAEIRIYEYMPDVCECVMQRSVRFALSPFDAEGLEFHIYANDDTEPCVVK